MSHWDTSTLVKLYAQEPDSAAFENYALNASAKAVTSRIALYEARPRSSVRRRKPSSNLAQHRSSAARLLQAADRSGHDTQVQVHRSEHALCHLQSSEASSRPG
jgi:uncharacterized protein with PIN domain